ncbi:MAG: oligosaccharide flippase family protein [Acidobacteriota bacterium]
MTATAKDSSTTILHNTFWYGIESAMEVVVLLGTSVLVARALGPTKLGYFSYINFFVSVVTTTSGTGLSTATRKYMSEFLALERPGLARAVYMLAHRYQLLGALAITALGLGFVVLWGEPGFKLMSSILIVAIIPGVMSWVPAQANAALQDLAPNTLSALGYMVVYALVILLTLHFHWDLVGVASAQLIGRTVELVLRTTPVERKLRKMPLEPLEKDVVHRIRRFCIQALGLQLLMSVVWDRSEMVFLRRFSDYTQMAFYSISFGLSNNLQMAPRVLGGATGITLMAEASRDKTRVTSMMDNVCRFLLLVVLPVNLGAAAIAVPAIHAIYGGRYFGAGVVMMVAALLSIPRAFQSLPEVLMRTADRQDRTLVWYGITGVVNLLLDWVLIRRYGAVGAAYGNGLAQTFGVMAIWIQARRIYDFHLPIKSTLRLGAAAMLMAAVAYKLSRLWIGLPGLIGSVAVSALVYVVLVRLFGGLEASDRDRLTPAGDKMPGLMRRAFLATIAFVTPAGA